MYQCYVCQKRVRVLILKLIAFAIYSSEQQEKAVDIRKIEKTICIIHIIVLYYEKTSKYIPVLYFTSLPFYTHLYLINIKLFLIHLTLSIPSTKAHNYETIPYTT